MIEGKDWASMDGIDVARAMQSPDSFVIVRAAYTYNGCQEDQTCKKVRDAAKKAGKTFGAYMILGFRQDGPTPEQQADNFIKIYGARRRCELPPALDLEADTAASLHMTVAQCLAWAERAYARLKQTYGVVLIYTSDRVWHEVFGGLSSVMGEAPLWLKVPYAWKVHNPPHPESCPSTYTPPGPWRNPTSPGAWIIQYQGDATGADGYTGTVDCNRFAARTAVCSQWLGNRVVDAAGNACEIELWQVSQGLQADGVIGPKGFALLSEK